MRPLIVGQAPGLRHGHDVPFDGPTGRRLAAILGIPYDDMHRDFDIVNLCATFPGRREGGDEFNPSSAQDVDISGRPLVILAGRAVANALNVDLPFLEPRGGIIVIPHPSGRNRWWNDPRRRARAECVLSRLVRRVQPRLL